MLNPNSVGGFIVAKSAERLQWGAMPRVVPDQKTKYETDELFKKLCQDMDVNYL